MGVIVKLIEDPHQMEVRDHIDGWLYVFAMTEGSFWFAGLPIGNPGGRVLRLRQAPGGVDSQHKVRHNTLPPH